MKVRLSSWDGPGRAVPKTFRSPRPTQAGRVAAGLLAGACLLLVIACAPSDVEEFNAAQQVGTVEALEAFIEKHPNSRMTPIALVRLDESHFERAKKENTVALWKDYLAKHADGKHVAEAQYALEQVSYKAAEKAGTREAIESFLKEFPNSTFTAAATRRMGSLEDIGKVALTEPKVEMDGDKWKVVATLENNSSKAVKRAVVQVQLLDAGGKVLATHEVAPVYSGGIFYGSEELAPDAWKTPLEPGQKREFFARSAKTPDGWTKQVKLELGAVEL